MNGRSSYANPCFRESAVAASRYTFADELQSGASSFFIKKTVMSSLTIPKWHVICNKGGTARNKLVPFIRLRDGFFYYFIIGE